MNALIYTYGGHERGMGHIYQSRALAEKWQEQGVRVRFAVLDVPEGVAKLRQWGMEVREIPHQLRGEEKNSHIDQALSGWEVDVALVDVLESEAPLMQYLARRADLLVSLDDIGEGRVWADLLINVIHHPPRPRGARYREINELCYVVLREEFQRAHQRVKTVPAQVRKLLVSQGGSDTFGGVVQLAEALLALPAEVEIHLLVGPAFRHRGPLAKVLEKGRGRFVLQRDVSDMAALMQEMDLAITGGGKTLFELAAVGVPLVAVTEEPRELETLDIVARHVLCENLGLRCEAGTERIVAAVRRLLPDRERRLQMSRSGKEAVDGCGAGRVIEAMAAALDEKRELIGGNAL